MHNINISILHFQWFNKAVITHSLTKDKLFKHYPGINPAGSSTKPAG